jgi:hypothetical protein
MACTVIVLVAAIKVLAIGRKRLTGGLVGDPN